MIKYFAIYDNYLMCYSDIQLLAYYSHMLKLGEGSGVPCIASGDKFKQYHFSATELQSIHQAYIHRNKQEFKELVFGGVGDDMELYFDDIELGLSGEGDKITLRNVGDTLSARDLYLNKYGVIRYGDIEIKSGCTIKQLEVYGKGFGVELTQPCNQCRMTAAIFEIGERNHGVIDKEYNKVKCKLNLAGIDASTHQYFNGAWYSVWDTILPIERYSYMISRIIDTANRELSFKNLCLRHCWLMNTQLKIKGLLDSTIKRIENCVCRLEYVVFSSIEELCGSKLDIDFLANTIISHLQSCDVTFNHQIHRLRLEESINNCRFIFNCDIRENAFSWIDTRRRVVKDSTFMFTGYVDKEVLNEFLDRLHLDDSSKVLVRRDVYDTLEVIDKIGKNLVYKDSNIKNLLQNF